MFDVAESSSDAHRNLDYKSFLWNFFSKKFLYEFMNSFILLSASVICSTEYAYEILA